MSLVSSLLHRGGTMPTLRKLTPEEIQALQDKRKGPRKLIEEQYNAILAVYEIGDYGEAELTPDENRLQAAAGRRGLAIEFKRTTGDLLRFYIPGHSRT